jgi:hypothetical protein
LLQLICIFFHLHLALPPQSLEDFITLASSVPLLCPPQDPRSALKQPRPILNHASTQTRRLLKVSSPTHRVSSNPSQLTDHTKRYTKNGTIKVVVGPANDPTAQQTFHIYRDLLSTVSPYFHARLSAQPNAANPHRGADIFIPEHDNDAINPPSTLHEPTLALPPFKQFIEWIYNKPLTTLATKHSLTADTYLLAHTLQSEAFRNDIVDAVRAFHATNPDAQLGLRSMVKLATAMPPEAPPNEGKVKLLEFLVAQMTYKILTRGWDDGGFQGNGLLKRLFESSTKCVLWHLDLLHEFLAQQGFVAAVQALRDGAAAAAAAGLPKDEDDEDNKSGYGPGAGAASAAGNGPYLTPTGKQKTKRPSIRMPPNPAEIVGCCFHEHKSRDSRCGLAMTIE